MSLITECSGSNDFDPAKTQKTDVFVSVICKNDLSVVQMNSSTQRNLKDMNNKRQRARVSHACVRTRFACALEAYL